MKKRSQRNFIIPFGLLAAFILWTVAVRRIDVQPVAPLGSSVGFAALNCLVLGFTGVHMGLYTITDWLSLVPIVVVLGFAILGLVQWIKRKRILKVDRSILTLGGFYVAVMAVYVFFEIFVINYRPVLIEGFLECSYPSSTTMLVMCVMPTALMQFHARIKNGVVKGCITCVMIAFTAFMVIGRLISGVHWFTDIIGGALLSGGLVTLYHRVNSLGARK